ncbi:hypothetical protein Cgig2_006437 [Carnegiea gigantea]|uniref:Uncharacterized protein n=1 Tax=Carnegiea gigantea TaxID=171969 RepID=A0A9Q1K8H7_9CARY|nr:hypothetical protein Cgig2_006437 [Carnegiea gigantea]
MSVVIGVREGTQAVTKAKAKSKNSQLLSGASFGNVDMVQNIVNDLRSHCMEPCLCWRNAPDENKEFWWRDFKDEYECLKHNASQSRTQVDDDELFLQAVRGKNKKGTVYALGTESEAYYPRTASRSSLAATTYSPSMVSQIEARLQKSEDDLQVARRP